MSYLRISIGLLLCSIFFVSADAGPRKAGGAVGGALPASSMKHLQKGEYPRGQSLKTASIEKSSKVVVGLIRTFWDGKF